MLSESASYRHKLIFDKVDEHFGGDVGLRHEVTRWQYASAEKKYARISKGLLTDGDEVKGRDLNAAQINRVVRLIKDRDAILEVTALDLALHTAAGVTAYQQQLAAEMQALLPQMPDAIRERVARPRTIFFKFPLSCFCRPL
jgi:hypothetical protein